MTEDIKTRLAEIKANFTPRYQSIDFLEIHWLIDQLTLALAREERYLKLFEAIAMHARRLGEPEEIKQHGEALLFALDKNRILHLATKALNEKD